MSRPGVDNGVDVLTSLAAIGDGAGGFVIEPVQVRALGPGEVRLALRAAGLCLTDPACEATGVAALAFLPLKLCRHGGHAVQLSGAHGPVSVEMPDFWWDKRCLVPLYGGCQPERDFPRLFDWAERGELALHDMVTHTDRLTDLGVAMDDMLAGRSAKGVIVFDGEDQADPS